MVDQRNLTEDLQIVNARLNRLRHAAYAGPMADAIDVVRAWHTALNAGDIDRLIELSTDDIEVGGPRGVGRGSDLLREWFERAHIRLEMGQIVERGEAIIVEQVATWQTAPDEPQTVASLFKLRDGRVASVVRFPSLADALDERPDG
jgi:ketosteroid isomerase-like protein